MKYEVILKLHEDDATGSWGLAPIDTISNDTSFNAFWGADGIFHDVFEHYCEGILPYYRNKGFMTIWGEMCASGHAIAYRDLGIDNFRYRKNRVERDFKADTYSIIQEYIYELSRYNAYQTYAQFDVSSHTCLCPYQKQLSNRFLECTISDYELELNNYAEETDVRDYRKHIWIPGIKRNYRYGFKQAQKIIGKDKKHSYDVLDKFLIDWNNITKMNPQSLFINSEDGEEMHDVYGFKFVVENNGKLKITTTVIDDYTRTEHPIELLEQY